MLVLGIETSCDETAASVVSDTKDIRSNVVLSQVAEHTPYGGVVPEIAARAHIEHMESVIAKALKDANVTLEQLDAIAATGGPGLIGGVIVGVMTAKALAFVHNKPFIAVNHLEGHALTVRLTHEVPFPFLLLLVSGGHCQLLSVEGVGQYQKLGGTVDDALGEAFDKTAKMMGLPYPGGPAVEKLAKDGNPLAYHFPTPMKGRDNCEFSFSGLKTAVRLKIQELLSFPPPLRGRPGGGWPTQPHTTLSLQQKSDIAASFQHAVAESVTDRLERGMAIFKKQHPNAKHFVLAGGVAANQYLREKLETVAKRVNLQLIAPPLALCTDNAAMIAWAGIERFKLGQTDGLDFEPRARWPLVGEA